MVFQDERNTGNDRERRDDDCDVREDGMRSIQRLYS
jgi:hypothetical protein